LVQSWKWLYGTDSELHTPQEISKHDLDPSVYGKFTTNKESYKNLGFIEKEQDAAEAAFELVETLDDRNKKILVKHLLREFGWSVRTSDEYEDETRHNTETTYSDNQVFSLSDWNSTEFPTHKVRNMDSLIEHVRQQFFCADPIKYKKVLRQIRTSKSPEASRAYVLGMYSNESGIKICQMCREGTYNPEAAEISNYGIELPQMHLCLCRNCASMFKKLRDGDKDNFKERMRESILGADIYSDDDCYSIDLNADLSVSFTQTHIAEIQKLFELIEEHGLPDKRNKSKEMPTE